MLASSIEQNSRALVFRAFDQVLHTLLAFRANQGSQVRIRFKTTIDGELLGPFSELREPFLGLAHHDQCAESHAPLTRGSERGASNGVQCVVLVGVWKDSGVVLGSQVGLDSLALRTAAGVDVLARTVGADERDRLDGRII